MSRVAEQKRPILVILYTDFVEAAFGEESMSGNGGLPLRVEGGYMCDHIIVKAKADRSKGGADRNKGPDCIPSYASCCLIMLLSYYPTHILYSLLFITFPLLVITRLTFVYKCPNILDFPSLNEIPS